MKQIAVRQIITRNTHEGLQVGDLLKKTNQNRPLITDRLKCMQNKELKTEKWVFFYGYNLVIQVKVYVAFTQEFLQERGHLKA